MTSSLQDAVATIGELRASIVIPTFNRCATLARVLDALGRQSAPPASFEVLVVSDGSTDGTVDLCRRVATAAPYSLRLIEQSNAGPGAARNLGVREARAPLIVFLDDDVVPDEGLLAAHFAAHAPDASDRVVAIGPLLPPRDTRLNAWGAWEERTLCSQYDAMEAGHWPPSYYQFYTGNASVARHHILAAGGFDKAFRRAEDIELGIRLEQAGCRFAFLPQARGWHYVRRRFASWTAMPVAYGEASVARARAGRVYEVHRDLSFYFRRNAAVRVCNRICLGSPWRVAMTTRLLGALAVSAWTVRLSGLAFGACSVIYNLRYYTGMVNELGGASTFWRLLALTVREPHGEQRSGGHTAIADALGINQPDALDGARAGVGRELEAGV